MDNFEELVNKIIKEDEYENLLEICDKEIYDNPKNWHAYSQKAVILHRLKQLPQALLIVNKSIDLNKNVFNLTCKGNILWRLNRSFAAIKCLNQALDIDSTAISALYLRARVYMSIYKYKKAIADAKKILEIEPSDTGAYDIIATIERRLGNHDNAIKTYKKAIEFNHKNAFIHWNLANCYCDNEEYDKAICEYNKSIEIDETFADTYWMIGNVYKYKRDLQTAIEYYTKAINLYPKGYQCAFFFDRAFAYKEIKEYKKALNDIKTAIELNCPGAEPYCLKAEIEYEMNLKEESITDLKKSLNCNKTFIQSYIALVCLYSEQKKYKEARKYLKQGLKIDPKNLELIKLQKEFQNYTLLAKIKLFLIKTIKGCNFLHRK